MSASGTRHTGHQHALLRIPPETVTRTETGNVTRTVTCDKLTHKCDFFCDIFGASVTFGSTADPQPDRAGSVNRFYFSAERNGRQIGSSFIGLSLTLPTARPTSEAGLVDAQSRCAVPSGACGVLSPAARSVPGVKSR